MSRSTIETHQLGFKLAKRLNVGDTVALSGEMGCGKTVLIKGICEGLGYADEVTSPSYTHVHLYQGHVDILHVDFYLDRSEDSIYDLGLDEYIGGNCIALIEWADRFPNALPKKCWWIIINHDYNNHNYRNISIFPINDQKG